MDRVDELRRIIHLDESSGLIDLNELDAYTDFLFPSESNELRFFFWMVTLRILPLDRSEWDGTMVKMLNDYASLADEFLPNREELLNSPMDEDFSQKIVQEQKRRVFREIHGDVLRSSGFFSSFTEIGVDISRASRGMEIILFIFASTDTYIQGFHDIVATFYLVVQMAAKVLGFDEEEVEAYTFTFFKSLITTTTLGDIYRLLQDPPKLMERFKVIKEIVYRKQREFAVFLFEKNNIDVTSFCFEWIACLYTRQLSVENSLQLWDIMFTRREHISEFCLVFGAAFILFNKSKLEKMNQASISTFLSRSTDFNLIPLLRITSILWSEEYE